MEQTIECEVCGSGTLRQRRVYRMSWIVVLIGYVLLLPPVLMASFLRRDGPSGFLLAAACLGSGLLGWLLVRKKRVLACSNCRALTPRS